MDPHPDPERPLLEGALRVNRRQRGVSGRRECHEERITLRIDLDASVVDERGTKDSSVLREGARIRI
jgi:hypothetical protein